jgi:glyoxylase-like metal-dependent hydrolase (beta-lactamase superfamily II)
MSARIRRRRWLFGSLTVLVMASVLLYRSHFPQKDPDIRIPVLGPSAITIVPGIHLLGGLWPAAAYVVETSAGLVLVDSGFQRDAGPLQEQMAELGLDWRRLRAILLTHVHADHSGGAQFLREATGAKVYAGVHDAGVLKAGGPPEAIFSYLRWLGPALHEQAHPTTVDVELTDEEAVQVGDTRFQALATPGHTTGSICYLLEKDNRRVLFGGDVINSLRGRKFSSSKFATPLGTYPAYFGPGCRGDARAFLSSLRRLRALPAPDLVLPGHPRMDSPPQSPALLEERWQAILDQGIRDMDRLVARYQKQGANFLDGGAKEVLPDLYYFGEFRGASVYGFFAAAKFFVVGAPRGPGLLDFVNISLQKLGVKPATPTAILLTSSSPEEMAGLNELVARARPQVVAAAAAVQRVEKSCPAGTIVLAAEDLPKRHWFQVRPIPLFGPGLGAIAYEVSWAHKIVLFSGRIPVPANGAALEVFRAQLTEAGNREECLASLTQLKPLKPDLWLPALPLGSQNANLYDSDWEEMIERNYSLCQ